MAQAQDEAAPEPHPGEGRPAAVWGWLAAYLLFRLLIDVVRLPIRTPVPVLIVANLVVALGSIGLPVGAIAAFARLRTGLGARLLVVLGGLCLWLGLAAVTPPGRGLFPILSFTLQDGAKVAAAGALGITLAAAVREPNILFPAGLFAAMADFIVVNFGTVKHALSTGKGQEVVKAVSAQVPAVHPSLAPLTIGPADFLFLGIFLACAARFGAGVRRTAWVLALVLGLSLVLVPFIGAVPALAPMSLAFLITNWRMFRLTRQELVGSLVVVLAAGGLFLMYFLRIYGRR